MVVPGAAVQWPGMAALRQQLEASPFMVPAGNQAERELYGPGDLIGVRYGCAACKQTIQPMDRLGAGDQHLREGALCGPVQEFEVRVAEGTPQVCGYCGSAEYNCSCRDREDA